MAELHVQPKKASNWWIWLLLALLAIVVIFFLSKGCNKTVDDTVNNKLSDTSASASGTSESGSVGITTPTTTTRPNGDIDFNSPNANYDEITDKDISVRGNNGYAIYSLGDNVLFDVDKSTISSDAQSKLKQIASSLGKRYADGEIRIYGHTDATGDASHNKQLSAQRAEAVKNWIIKNANMKEDRITIIAEGESDPVASNATEQEKQKNRSVQIVAKQR